MLSCLPHRPSDSSDDSEFSGSDTTDEMLEVRMINSGNISLRLLLNMAIR